ncbi:hypothetical protein JN535_18780 [Cellulosimicrobium cellulans]|uniref:DUF6882 domain-containing protein n=1 Tax=Cellulosimicrobium cellulans TaxID=1710 RepID=UPI0019653A41|nr:DUF6882 domain-containing protein [Cellulosimicrobium cellulans]MBN0042205.1 hypothetical protein [Cellulosimicrobium cellulans]
MTEPQTAHGTADQTAPALQELVDDAAFLSHEHQLHLADRHGDDAWGAEMTTGSFTFTSATGETTTCRLQFLGTAAPGPGSWMWAWNNVNGFPEDVLRAAEKTREAGLPEATEAELPLTDDLPYRLALAAKTVTGSWTHYSAPVGGGTRAWFLLDTPTASRCPRRACRASCGCSARACCRSRSSTTAERSRPTRPRAASRRRTTAARWRSPCPTGA